MLKMLFSIALVLLLSGTCAAGGDMIYNDNEILAKGAQIKDDNGLFTLTVTDDGYFVGKGADVIELVRGAGDAYERGNYRVQTFPASKVPAEAQNDLRKSFDWINQKVIAKSAKKKVQIVQAEERDFQGVKALYVESIFPGKTGKGPANLTVIHSYGFAYANIVFYSKDRLYWIYYSAPETDPSLIKTPEVKDGAREKFEEFLSGISLEL